MHDTLDYDEVRRLRGQNMPAADIAKRLGVSKHVIFYVIKKLGLPRVVPRERPVDVPKLFETWNNPKLTIAEVARELGILPGYLYTLADRYGLPERESQRRAYVADSAPPEEEAASRDSLALAPAVQRRIEELGLGMPVMEQPDVRPWFAVTTEPGPYADDPEDGYAYDE
jgi:hypothetical protein